MKVLLVRPAALGDTLMLMPAIAQLRAAAEIFLVGRSPGVDILRPYVHRSIDYEGSGWHRLFMETLDQEPSFPLPKVNSVVAFLSDPDGSLEVKFKGYLPDASINLLPPFPPKGARVHVAFYLAQCLKCAGLPLDPKTCIEDAYKRPLLGGDAEAIQKKKIVLHPGSGGKGKNHPPDFWLELVSALYTHLLSPTFTRSDPPDPSASQPPSPSFQSISPPVALILLGPAEEELRPFFTKNLRTEGIEILFAPEKKQLITILRQAPLYIGHDSGITHLAAMLGTPTIALFKKSPIHQWRPLGPAVRVIENEENRETLMGKVLEEARKFIGTQYLSSIEAIAEGARE